MQPASPDLHRHRANMFRTGILERCCLSGDCAFESSGLCPLTDCQDATAKIFDTTAKMADLKADGIQIIQTSDVLNTVMTLLFLVNSDQRCM